MESRNVKKNNFDYALFEAVKAQQFLMVDELIKAGANPNGHIDSAGNSCAHLAVKLKNEFILISLLEAGADITLKNNKGDTPIGLAARCEDDEAWYLVKTIVFRKNNIRKYHGHMAALSFAIIMQHRDTVRMLLEAGTSVNFIIGKHKDERSAYTGWTPLQIAVYLNDPTLVALLLKFGADFSMKGKINESAMDIAARLHRWDCIKLFVQHNEELTGEGIYKKLISTSCQVHFPLYSFYKEAVFAYILQIRDRKNRIEALENAQNKQTQLGAFFWWQRGGALPSFARGLLKKIITQLELEYKADAKSVSSTAKIIQAVPTSETFVVQPAVDSHYYPDLTVPTLAPVYNPTLTSQLNDLPKVSDLPRLPIKEHEEKNKIAQAAF